MAAKKRVSRAQKSAKPKSAKSAKAGKTAQLGLARPIAKLEAQVRKLRASLVAEARRRKLDQRILAEAKRARAGVIKQMSALRAQGLKLAAQIKRAAHENRTLQQGRQTALAKVEELREELRHKSEEVRRTSAELAKLARESASRARDIVHSRGLEIEPHHRDPDVEGVPDDEPFSDDPFPGEKPPI